MDFNETGLPADPTVFKAFRTYEDQQKTLPRERQSDFPLRVARVLSETTGADSLMISAALLFSTPSAIRPVIEKRFGGEVAQLLGEAERHARTQYAHIQHASPEARILTAAGALVSFDEFRRASEQMSEVIDDVLSGGEKRPVPVVMMPDTKIFDLIENAIASKTSFPAFERRYIEGLADFKIFNQAHMEKLTEKGLLGGTSGGQLPPGMNAPAFEKPSFEETGLMDTPKIRTAYDIISCDPRVLKEDFDAALACGKMLSGPDGSKNPTAIAAGLIDVGIRDMTNDDLELFKSQLDWDVLDVLKSNSIYEAQTPARLMKSPVEFRQIALVNAISVVEQTSSAVMQFRASLEKQPELYRPDVVMPGIQQPFIISKSLAGTFLQVMGTTDMPLLEDRLERKNTELLKMMTDMAQKASAPRKDTVHKDNFGFDP